MPSAESPPVPAAASGTDRRQDRRAGDAGWTTRGGDRRQSSPIKAYGSLERSFAACGLVAALGTAGGAVLTMRGYGPAAVLAVTSTALLLCVTLGTLASDRVVQYHRGELARVYVTALEAPRRAVFDRRRAAPTRTQALRHAVADMVARAQMAVFGRDRLRVWAMSMRRALDDRAEISRTLAAALGEDAHAIAAAATASRRAEAEIDSLFARAGQAACFTSGMEEAAESLEAGVRATTAQLGKATALAASLGDNAMSAQRELASIAEVTEHLLHAADRVQLVLRQMEAAALDGGLGAIGTVAALASGAQQALGALTEAARVLREDGVAVSRAVNAIGEGVQAHGALGDALMKAVTRQMEEVGRLVARANNARTEIASLEEQASATDRRDLGLASSPAARRAVERLPAHAEAIARILRDLPSLDPVRH